MTMHCAADLGLSVKKHIIGLPGAFVKLGQIVTFSLLAVCLSS